MNEDEQHKITILLGEVAAKIQVLLDKQDELAANIAKIKEAVYNPDQGLYARLTRLDSRLEALEVWKNNNTKVLWLIVSIGFGLVANTVWQQLF